MKEVQDLVNTYQTKDPVILIEALNCSYTVAPMGEKTFGMTVSSDDQISVVINGNIPVHQQKFVAAHELGHIVNDNLNESMIFMREANFGLRIPKIEADANRFAFNLLLYDLDYDFESESINLYTVLHYFHLPDSMIRFITPLPIKSGGD